MNRGIIKMRGMNYLAKFATHIIIAGALVACASPTPRLTKEQKDEQAFKTLNFYPDNRVGMKTKNETYWLDGNGKDMAFVIRLDTQMFNMVDVRSVKGHLGSGELLGKPLVTATLMNGQTVTAPVENTWWVKCISSHDCPAGITTKLPLALSYGNPMSGLLVSVLNHQLVETSGKENAASVVHSTSKFPSLYGDVEIQVLHAQELSAVQERLQKLNQAYDAKAPERATKLAASTKQYEEEKKRRTTKLKSIKIGTTTLCRTTTENLKGNIEDSMSLSCREIGEESWIFEMRKLGWQPIHVESKPSEAVGMAAAGFQFYLVTFQKVR